MRVGVVFCECGGQISEHIDIDRFKDKILGNKEIEWLEFIGLACAEDNKDYIINLIKEKPVDGLIILGCSPNLKGQYLEEIAKDAGISPYMINIVNIREQVLWVTVNKSQALKKIYALFMGALYRLREQKPIQPRELKVCPDIMVVGGGIAGITTSITLTKFGRKVYLVERERFLGGRVSNYETIFPSLECAPCIIHPLIDEVINSKTIELMTNAEVSGIKGSFGNLIVKIQLNPNNINPKRCIGCFACIEVCPQGCITIDPKKLPIIANIDIDRCLRQQGKECALCLNACPVTDAIDFDATTKKLEVNVGAVVWATGFDIFDCSRVENLCYGKFPNIYTSLEFEDILHHEGHTKGNIVTKEGRVPSKICIIHCVGSLDEEYYSHCSKICCQYAFKFNRLIRQRLPRASITHITKELVLPGIHANNLYMQSKNDKKVHLVRYKSIKDIRINKEGKRLSIHVCKDKILSDIVVLCPAILLGSIIENEKAGIVLSGSVKEPMTIEETKTDALAQVSNIVSLLKDDNKVKKSLHFANFDYNKCSRCGICVCQCPYEAIQVKASNTIEISDILCEGCGICAVACPSKAIDIEGFTDRQITFEIEGILETLKEVGNCQ